MAGYRVSTNNLIDRGWRSAAQQQLRVVGAIMLRDMRTRFGRTHLGFIIQIGWPLSHLTVLLMINVMLRRIIPFGTTDATVFLSAGLLPYILCLYPARLIMLAIASNRPLLNFPIVKTTDLIYARVIVEMLSAFFVATIFCVGLYFSGVDFVPNDVTEALEAVFAAIFLGMGIGIFNVAMFALFKHFAMVAFILIMVVAYASAGVFIPITTLPESIQSIAWYNPLVHLVEWLRSAYYTGYTTPILSKTYVLAMASIYFFLGLLLDKLLRGRSMVD